MNIVKSVKNKPYFALLLLLSGLANAQFEPPVVIDPPNPSAGDTINIGLFHTYHYPCLILPVQNLDGETHLFDFDNNIPGYPENHIDLIVVAETIPLCNPFPVTPAPREYYTLGQLPPGEYSLRTGLITPISQFPLPPDKQPTQYGEILTFTVSGFDPIPLNSTTNKTLSLLTIFILISTLFMANRKKRGKNEVKQ